MEGSALRLLIVDDDEVWRDVLGLLFADKPEIKVTLAVSGADALEKVGADDYDLVLLDMRMPSGVEGLDALREIKLIKPQTGVMIMSAYGDIRKSAEAIRRGALDFVPKEADFKEVIAFEVNKFIRTFHLIADRERLIRSKYEEVQRARSAQKKGRALEDLIAALFASIDGFREIARDRHTKTEEIDLVFRNESRAPAWEKEGAIILVECKNWHSQRVGKNEFVLFKEKIENRAGRCKLGFLVCTEKFTETIEKEMLRSSKTDLLVVPLDGDDLRQLVEAENRSEVLRNFADRALLS